MSNETFQMVDWSEALIDMQQRLNSILNDLNNRQYDDADEQLTQLVVSARMVRLFILQNKGR